MRLWQFIEGFSRETPKTQHVESSTYGSSDCLIRNRNGGKHGHRLPDHFCAAQRRLYALCSRLQKIECRGANVSVMQRVDIWKISGRVVCISPRKSTNYVISIDDTHISRCRIFPAKRYDSFGNHYAAHAAAIIDHINHRTAIISTGIIGPERVERKG